MKSVATEKGKILVIRGGAIGDFVLTLPVLAALRERFPEVHLEVLGYPRVTQLALAGGLVDQAQPIEARAMASFFAKGGTLPEHLAEYFGSFDLVLSYLYDPDRIFQENVARCSEAQFIVGPHRPDESGSLHATDVFLQPLVRLAIFDADPTPRLTLKEDSIPGVGDSPAPLSSQSGTSEQTGRGSWLAMHPGSGSERKNWPAPKWHHLLRRLAAETSLRFLLIAGEAEGDRLQDLAALVPGERLRIAQSLPLANLGFLLKQSTAYIGHDSGISHLAAALGLNCLILWGDTKQQIWRPRSERVRLLQPPGGLSVLEVDDVFKRIHSEWAVRTESSAIAGP